MAESLITVAVLAVHAFAISGLLLTERSQPIATLAWLFALIFLPGVGLLLYFLLGTGRFRRITRRSARAGARLEQVLQRHRVRPRIGVTGEDAIEPRTYSLLRLGRSLSSTPASQGNRAQILIDGAATYLSMQESIESARDHVHVEFYIIQADPMGRALRDLLVERARAGVKVRVLCDAVGSQALPGDFWNPVLDAGGEAAIFHPVLRIFHPLLRRGRVDFRNHRKIVVVDGEVGFTGGINIGREYLGLDPHMGRWRDTHVRIAGPAVLSLQKAFVQDWLTATGRLIDDEGCFPDPGVAEGGECVIQVVDSGPDRRWSPILYVYTHAIALARQTVWITSPYFIPGPTLEDALISAALRGVDVRLLLPRRSDVLLVTLASRSYYRRLLQAGARIFHYDRGFLHAKTMVVDDWVGTVGSANMDLRSFYLNFELNAFVHGDAFAGELARQFLADQEETKEVTLEELERRAYTTKLLYAAARLLSPLL